MRRHAFASLLALAAAPNSVYAAQAAAQLDAPRARLLQQLHIDGSKEDWSITNLIMVSPSGRIVIPQPEDRTVLVYDANGKRLYTFGRRGDGPGEFQFIWPNMGWIGDTAWFYDFNHRRLTLMDPAGKLVRTVPVRPPTLPALNGHPAVIGVLGPRAVLADGTIALTIERQEPAGIDPITGEQADALERIVAATPDGEIKRHIASLPPRLGSYVIGTGPAALRGEKLFAPVRAIAQSHDGTRMGTLTTHPARAGSDTLRLTVFRPSGDTVFSRLYLTPHEDVPRRVVDSMKMVLARPRTLGGVSREPDPEQVARFNQVNSNTDGMSYPFVRWLRFGADSTIWLQRRTERDEPQVWFMLDHAGAPVAMVPLPKGHAFRAGTRTQVWTVSTDADGFGNVTRWRVAR